MLLVHHQAMSATPSTMLDQLVFCYNQANSLEDIGAQLQNSLQTGDSAGARVLLDAAEMKHGPWTSSTPDNIKIQLGVVHLFVLLTENDINASRHLTHRLQSSESTPLINAAAGVYERMWREGAVAASEHAQSLRETCREAGPLVLSSLEVLIARFHARQLELTQRAYTTISVELFGRNLGLSSKEHVEKFCGMPPDRRFEVKDNFVHVSRPPHADSADSAAQIEKLTNLVVFLEGETTTFINSKIPTSASGGASSATQ